jgi:formylglycine-generating enzyme required for sulfatase activity
MKKLMSIIFILVLIVLTEGVYAKKIIQMGYCDPNTALFATNIGDMKNQPFDGTDFYAEPLNPTTRNQFSWQCWGTTTFSRSSLQHCIEELNAVEDYGEFKENFLKVTVAADKDVTWFVDWFDDFSSITSNMCTAAWMVKQGGSKGIMFDMEPYSGQLWQYSAQKYKSTKTFSQYQVQVRQRGREIMQAMQAEDPNILIFLPVSYSYVWGPSQINGNIANLQNVEYGLLPSFLDGMLDVAGSGVKFVDGYEAAYKFKTLLEFQNARTVMTSGCLPIVANTSAYLAKFSVGFGLWMDVDHRIGGWYENPAEQYLNYFNPDEFENALKYALSVSDEYVWIYSETLYWWNIHGGSKNVPYTYKAAVQFGGSDEFMEFVTVGDAGNAADNRAVTYLGTNYHFGNVPYEYKIGKYEVTNAQYCKFLNAVAKTDTHELYNTNMADATYPSRGGIIQNGSVGSYTYSTISSRAHLPVNWVSWRSAARFANWMHNGMKNDANTTEYGAYDASTFTGDAGSKFDQAAHSVDANCWIPTTNEWYKAAFYKGGSTNAGYWSYATKSDVAPNSGPYDVNTNMANYNTSNYDFGDGFDNGDMISTGFYTASPSAYGTFDQSGNAYELLEEWCPTYEQNLRRRYGGAWYYSDSDQLKYTTLSYDWYGAWYETGFRLASFSGSRCLEIIAGDTNNDCKIDFEDLAVISEHWLECNRVPASACHD